MPLILMSPFLTHYFTLLFAVGIDIQEPFPKSNDLAGQSLPIYKRDGIDLWSTITNFQIIRRAAWPEADRSAEISEENL